MIDPQYRPEPDELRALEEQVSDAAEELWRPPHLDTALSGWVHSVSPRGVYREALSAEGGILEDPHVYFAPAVILRKRTERSFLRAFREIIGQLETGAPIPPGVGRFLEVPTESREAVTDGTSRADLDETEPYFPLEWNDAQRQIVERLETHEGVLVQGPPGTGKSHTIVNLICHLLASGQRVLVTSHTARALRVLQGYIRDRATEISPLAVVLLGNDREALQAMEDSVQGITHRHNHWIQEASDQRIDELGGALDQARRDESVALSDLRSIRESETYRHPPRFGGYGGTLQQVARRLREEQDLLDWIPDDVADDEEAPFSSEHFVDLLALVRSDELNRWESQRLTPVDLSALPSPEQVDDVASRESQMIADYEDHGNIRLNEEYAPLASATTEARATLGAEVATLLTDADQVTRHLQGWTEQAVREILGDQDRAWRDLFRLTTTHLSEVRDRAGWADELAVAGLEGRDRHQVRADAELMRLHLESGRGWGIGPFRAALAKRSYYLRAEVSVNGEPCDTAERLQTLLNWLDVDHRLDLLRERWQRTSSVPEDISFGAQVGHLEDLCEPLEAALGLHGQKANIQRLVEPIEGLSEPTWHDFDAIRRLLRCISAADSEVRLNGVKDEVAAYCDQAASQANSPGTDGIARALLGALQSRDGRAYRDAFREASNNQELALRLDRRDGALTRLSACAPLLAKALEDTPTDERWDTRAPRFAEAWSWARARSWVNRACSPGATQQAMLQLDSARDRKQGRLSDIAAEKAWGHCFHRMSEHQRQHLVAWSKAVRSIGRGKGKYAAQHRRNAREHMNECRPAIPAWVMPLYRVAEAVKPGVDLFDVVIIDEASQSGPEALLLAYLAKKMVVVGDDKQISPTYAGVNHEDVNHLRARHLSDIPHSDAYGVHQSFFDLAEIRYQGRIRLREHFRCMPEIIQFSNNLCYASEPLIPLRQYGSSRLSPVVSARHVSDGYIKGTGQSVCNPPEAQAVVDEVVRLSEEDSYRGKTIGVISLLGGHQARLIESLLLSRLGSEVFEERQLACGDAYAFQGDERDVMLLSLVSAPTEDRRIRSLTDEASRRRFNVAASRARDQMTLFHSATLNDLSPNDLRFELLQYCQNPSVQRAEYSGKPVAELERLAATANRQSVRPPEPFGSWFELDVFLKLVARGFRVLPQYEVAGYRIDLVIDGMENRVAVECDGDIWHGADKYEADMARQRMLERCGWKFWRLRESAFRMDSEDSLRDLWATLERERVFPEDRGRATPVSTDRTEQDRTTVQTEDPSAAPPAKVLRLADLQLRTQRPEPRGLELGPPNSVAPSGPSAPPDETRLSDGPFSEWSSLEPLPIPTQAHRNELLPGLTQIVRIEGPMKWDRLCRVFVRGAGLQRVGRRLQGALDQAIHWAVRNGHLEKRKEVISQGVEEVVLWSPGTPSVRVRPLGSRDFSEIPASEIAELMTRIEEVEDIQDEESRYRSVISFYSTRRMTANIRERLKRINAEHAQLLSSVNDSGQS